MATVLFDHEARMMNAKLKERFEALDMKCLRTVRWFNQMRNSSAKEISEN